MIRPFYTYFPRRTFVLGISEICLIYLILLITGGVRPLTYRHSIVSVALVSLLFFACMSYFDLYDSAILGDVRDAVTRLVQVSGTVYILSASIDFVFPGLELSRGILLLGPILILALLSIWRKLFLVINGAQYFADRALILGDGPLVEPLLREFESRPELGLRAVSRIASLGELRTIVPESCSEGSSMFVGSHLSNAISDALRYLRVNRIVVAMSERRGRLPVELLLAVKCSGVRIQDGTDLYETITGKVPIESVPSGWLLFSPGFCVTPFIRLYKRLSSIFVAICGLLLSLPLLPFIVLAVKLGSPGPILYRQRRVGTGGTTFYCYKFRTMRADAEADIGPTWATDDDPRITGVGHFMRKTRVDEIPQLWNVLVGEMSLVGPRPERPEFVKDLRHKIRYYDLRHTVRPGITGWAQISYKYGNSVEDAKEKLRYDLFYIKHISPGMDLMILFRTIKTILLGRGAK